MPTSWLELDRVNLLHNVARLRALVQPAKIMAVVKANAYGAGAVPIATALAAEGVDAFAVASVPEAVELREAGVRARLLVLTYFAPEDVEAILTHDLRPAVFTLDAARWLSEAAAARQSTARAWVKVDTGLGRLGVPAEAAGRVLRRVAQLPALAVEGLFSTLAENPERSAEQMARLRRVRAELPALAGVPISIASSQGILSLRESYLDVVRPGLTLLGVASGAERLDAALAREADLRPVVTWKARVAYVKVVPRGEQVGYGPRAPLERATPIATLAVGWADGYAQTLAGSGHVLLHGRRCPVLAISANSAMVDVAGLDGVDVGAEAVLVGRQGAETIAAEEIARSIGSLYRVLATIPRAVPRAWS